MWARLGSRSMMGKGRERKRKAPGRKAPLCITPPCHLSNKRCFLSVNFAERLGERNAFFYNLLLNLYEI